MLVELVFPNILINFSYHILSPWRLRGCVLFLRPARLCVTVHPSLGLLAVTSGGCRGNSLFKVKLLPGVDRDGGGVWLTNQLQRQMGDGLISTPQLISELLHLLQESLNLNTHPNPHQA